MPFRITRKALASSATWYKRMAVQTIKRIGSALQIPLAVSDASRVKSAL